MGHRNREGGQTFSIQLPPQQDLQKIIQGEPDESAEKTVHWAKLLGEALKKELTTSQIRGIFGQVRRLEMNWSPFSDAETTKNAYRDLLLLKPKIAYQAGREKEKKHFGVEELSKVLLPAIDLVQGNRDYFQRFVDFFEAILAYHKAAGGS